MPLRAFAPAPGQSRTDVATVPFPKAESVASGRTARSQSKAKPSPQELERLRTEKRADIERRCQTIDPPIRTSILPFMDAYNAAVQISMPLNDSAWDTLKHRLIAQREEAEQKEMEHLHAQEALQLRGEDKVIYEEQHRLDQAADARMWDELGTPARQKLNSYADEHIATIWAGGTSVTATNSANFAADVLVHAVKRFHDSIVDEDKMLASRNMRLPTGSAIPEIRRLKLEDVKWVFDESVRPHTERFGKDVFLCSVCEGTAKRFPFEGMIQHFAAKHTNELSKGNQVVYWKAEWPRNPPFHTSPESIWNAPPASHSMSEGRHDHGFRNVLEPLPLSRSPGESLARSSTLAEQPSRPPNLYEQHCNEVTEAAADALHVTEGIFGLPDSVRLYVIIHRIVRSFRSKFPNEPSLTMFIDCVSYKSSLRKLRDLHGLRCRACRLDTGVFHQRVPREWWLPELLAHFQACHAFQGFPQDPYTRYRPAETTTDAGQQLDWKYDMIELPTGQIIRNLAQAPGMDEIKFEAIREMFPAVFARTRTDYGPRQEYTVRRYYIPIEEDYEPGAYRPVGWSRDGYGQNLGSSHDMRDDRGRNYLSDQPGVAGTVPGFMPVSPGYRREALQPEVRYRPQREIVYFDDHDQPGSLHRPAFADDPRHHDYAPVQRQSMASLDDARPTYLPHPPASLHVPEHLESRNLPLRLHRSEISEDENPDHAQTLSREASTRGAGEVNDKPEAGALVDADQFLSTIDSDSLGGPALSMSRTASAQRRALADNDVVSIKSSRLSHSGTPSRMRLEGSSFASQIASRIDTPAESHASLAKRAASRSSVIAKSDASDTFHSHDAEPLAQPRTPPASRSSYAVDHDPIAAQRYSGQWSYAGPPVVRREYRQSRPENEGVVSEYETGRQRYSPASEGYYRVPPPESHLGTEDCDGRRAMEQDLPPEMTRYEFSRLPPHEAFYAADSTPRIGYHEPRAAPRPYSGHMARSRPGERNVL
jgi:hypothetical protein